MYLNRLPYLSVLLLTLSGQAFAHGFHYQLDVASQLQENANGELTGVRMNWFYDTEVTDMLLEGEDLSADKRAQTLQTIGQQVIADLGKLHYFTNLSLDGKPLALAAATDFHMDLSPDNHLNLNFLLPLPTPQNLHGKHLDIAMADSTGSAVLAYKDVSRIRLGEKLAAACTLTLQDRQAFADGEPAQLVRMQCK
ncbi:MAG: DUF1007 family protein [Candidatus Thiothrix singaporensis]|uniref:DUF1007 family protein n=1 Tax=Candidatus Thiothrix singaporensis TaxID=2799669 RepID=A0A7L6ART3_9GAMM|nr:MAG: DUF1007 family protein [Candidatus Thiothrix singaporensis]